MLKKLQNLLSLSGTLWTLLLNSAKQFQFFRKHLDGSISPVDIYTLDLFISDILTIVVANYLIVLKSSPLRQDNKVCKYKIFNLRSVIREQLLTEKLLIIIILLLFAVFWLP